MAVSYTNNDGSTFININECRSFNQTIDTTLTALTSQVCSEVVVVNRTGSNLYIYDSNYFDNNNRLLLLDNESIVIRGITNSSQVSAIADSAGTVYYRTQYFSNLPQR